MHFDVVKELIKEKKQLENLIRIITPRTQNQPDGSLVIYKKTGYLQYYHNIYNPGTGSNFNPCSTDLRPGTNLAAGINFMSGTNTVASINLMPGTNPGIGTDLIPGIGIDDTGFYSLENKADKASAPVIKIRKYLTSDDPLIKSLAQKAYDNNMLRAALAQKSAIEAFLKKYDMDSLKRIYTDTSPERRALIQAEIIDDEEYARRWSSVQYTPGYFEEGFPEFYTLRGERVRSKSETIIANTYNSAMIPYRYEFPFCTKDGEELRPDFRVLNKRTRREFIHEHLGKMDDPEYCRKALERISIYMQNGYFPGENLIITAESSTRPFSTKDLDMIIQHYFL